MYAVWFDMLVADSRDQWDANLMPDARVTHLWDQHRRVGCWYGKNQPPKLHFGPIVWDTYYLYGPDARWDEVPEPLIGSGYTILAARQSLANQIAPLLGTQPDSSAESARFVGQVLDAECPGFD